MPDSGLSIAIIGNIETPEMSLLKKHLEQLCQSSSSDHIHLEYFTGLENFLEDMFHQEKSFPLILVLQNRPREYSGVDILKLIESAPISRILCCYSSWCESDARNDADLWPIAVLVPVRACLNRICKELDVIGGLENPLPLTASREETYLHFILEKHLSELDLTGKTFLIRTPDLEFRLMLEELLTLCHGEIVLSDGDHKADICIWDADPFNEDQIEQIETFQKTCPETWIIPLMNFPQPEDISCLRDKFQIPEVIPKLHLTGFLSERIQNLPDQQTAS